MFSPVKTSQTIQQPLKPLHDRLNSLILEDKSQPQILRQLLLLHAAKLPKGLLKNSEVDYSYPATQDIDKLSLIHKVSVLFRTKGPRATRQILAELDWKPLLNASVPPLPSIEELENYSRELSSLTDGVMPAYSLNPCRALYMLFYSYMERCEKSVDPSHPCWDALVEAKDKIGRVFWYFENVPDKDQLPDFRRMGDHLRNSIKNLKKLKAYFVTQPHSEKRLEDSEKMIKIAELLQKAAVSPVALLPFLKRPLRVDPSVNILGDDIFNVHFEKAKEWLEDYFTAWKSLSSQYLTLLELTLQKNGKSRDFASRLQETLKLHKEVLEENEGSQKNLLDLLRRLRPLQELLSSKEVFDSSLVAGFRTELEQLLARLLTHHQKYMNLDNIGTLVKEIEQFPEMCHPSVEGLTVRDGFLQTYKGHKLHLPYNCWLGAFFAVHNALRGSMDLLELTNKRLLQHVPQDLMRMNSPHVTLVDLLEYQQRAISKERTANKGTHLVDACLSLIFAEIRRFPRSPDAKDLANRNPLIQSAETLLHVKKDDPHYKLLKMVSDILKMPNGPAWFFRNPHAAPEHTASLENRFFEKAFPVLIHSFLTVSFAAFRLPFERAFMLPVQVHEKECAQEMQKAFGNIAAQFETWHSSVRERPIPAYPARKDFAQFIEEMRRFMSDVDQEIETAAQLMAEHISPSASLKAIHQQFLKLKETIQTDFENHFVSFCSPFIKMIEEEELQQEKKSIAKRRKPASALKPLAKEPIQQTNGVQPSKIRPPASPPPAPPTIESSYQTLRQICQARFADSKGFKTSPKATTEDVLLLTLQQETSTTLLGLMEDFRELIDSLETHGHKPFYLLQLHSRIATLLEQASKHVAANLKIPISDSEEAHLLTFQQGKECFWKTHAPLQIIQKVEERLKPTPWKLNESQKKLMANLERVVAISSRYPGSGEDSLSASIGKSLDPSIVKSDLKRQAEKLLQDGMETCLAILAPVTKTQQNLPQTPFSAHQLEQWLTVAPVIPLDDGMDALNAVEKALRRLEAYRLPRAHRSVTLITDWDSSAGKRLGTIDSALRNLKSSAQICRSLLAAEVEPSLSATIGTTALLQEAVLLEQMQLAMLAMLPHPSSKNPEQHFLYAESSKTLNRYSHGLKQFAKEIPAALATQNVLLDASWIHRMQEQSSELEPFLKELYRYRKLGMPLLDKLYGLSALRNRIVRGQLAPQEAQAFDSMMKVADPIERLEKLDGRIIEILNTEIRQPLIEMLWLVAEGLNIHEQLVLKF
ncbi:MAG: hypothetical protein LLG04_05565 [Parachlamydia sp.]|nr:hypothetical protein [Parachlamydia sp.]